MPALAFRAGRRRRHSFTLVELLVVIAIIAILAGLTLAAGEAVMTKAARSRTSAEIQTMAGALENYKTDNGVYPWVNNGSGNTYTPIFATTNDYMANDASVSGGDYEVSSQLLYQALSGQTNFEDTPAPGVKRYMSFKANQLGNATTAANSGYTAGSSTYIQDAFGYSYGYFAPPYNANNPAAGSVPINGNGFFDLWSTGNTLESSAPATIGTTWANAWIANWPQQ